jgi:hypothetical protein
MKKKPEKKDQATEKENVFFVYKGKRKYTINAKKSSILEKTFLIHKPLTVSSVFYQLYKTLQLALSHHKC